MQNSFDLLKSLKAKNLLDSCKDPLWWNNSGTFEIVVGAILAQNTKWENVEFSLQKLKELRLLDLEAIAKCDLESIQSCIIKSGFFRQKAYRIQKISQNILNNFSNFENFRENVSREWLLNQKGIGKESADSILNYCCFREIMVVDKYTARLLSSYGFEFYEYDDIASWLMQGIIDEYDKVISLYGHKIELYKVYARFHAKIVEYSKIYKIKSKY
ncbi:3-methyladenine DNA glycosylase [Helicobacter sp. MIT 14-3879]|uniref:3-methyladenine DNA glycosylase n=1 Tax=Helicobacter sp. MIT 14-3879 TaxID=2040649 RepID=UPI000E1EC548|nr:3-methyladenine DNA glycosylase [Helicobacter sp. MIT 14-3879]RDU65537.1 3-methyladenine DNA glycosylase [Helicobacter sp. MIT 14-3879]